MSDERTPLGSRRGGIGRRRPRAAEADHAPARTGFARKEPPYGYDLS